MPEAVYMDGCLDNESVCVCVCAGVCVPTGVCVYLGKQTITQTSLRL